MSLPAWIRSRQALIVSHTVPPVVTPLTYFAIEAPSLLRAISAASAMITTASYDSALYVKSVRPLSWLRSQDNGLTDFTYSAESYDAVVIIALAAEMARSNEGASIAKYVNGVTTGGTVCETIKACLDLIHAGKDIAYRG